MPLPPPGSPPVVQEIDLNGDSLPEFSIRTEVAEACDQILKAAKQNNVFAAIFANDFDFARPLYEAGWDLITVGTDMGLLERAAGDVVKSFRDME